MNYLGNTVRKIIRAAENDGLRIDDGNVIDLLADQLPYPLAELRAALRTAGYESKFPNACRERV